MLTSINVIINKLKYDIASTGPYGTTPYPNNESIKVITGVIKYKTKLVTRGKKC